MKKEKNHRKKQRKMFIVVGMIVLVLLVVIVLKKQPVQETANAPQYVELKNGDVFKMEAKLATKSIDDRMLTLFTYNGQFPGPLLRVRQNSRVNIEFKNSLDQETTIHWHGLRHNYKFDGVPDISQPPVKPGETFHYELLFPDEGVFWYHPHVREDIQQERGMYGMIIVEPAESRATPREVPLILDDMLLAKDNFYPFPKEYTNFAIMGRFGNIMLLNGEVQPTINAKQGETLRFYLLNTANVRPFNVSIEKTQMKIIGSDIGGYEEAIVADNVVIGPAERYIMDVTFADAGAFNIYHTNPDASYNLGKIVVEKAAALKATTATSPQSDIANYKQFFAQAPNFELSLDIDMRGMMMGGMMDMHAEEGSIEWEDTMFMMNEMHNSLMMTWFIEDIKTGKRNMDIVAEVEQGDIKTIRIKNEEGSEHPMQHPIHLHGQRFLVLREDGEEKTNLVWKDTVLIPKGSTVDLLVDFSNPGIWMMHCHIAEHLHAGMMMGFNVKGGEEK